MDGGESGQVLVSRLLDTDQPLETVRLQRPLWLEGVTFWTVNDSVRLWTMHHDTFTASLVLGPSPTLRATWCSRGEERVVTPGCTQLMVPGETHRTTAVSEPASFFVLWWSPETMEQCAQELGLGTGRVHFTRAQIERTDVAAALRSLHAAVNANQSRLEIDQYYVESTTLLLEHAAERSPLRPRLGRHHPSVKRALDMLHDVYARNVSLDDLAQETRLSKFHLARCFRETTGMAPHQYQKLLRLQAGRRLLEAGDSVRDTAARTGFADAAHFARAFRTWLGVSPSQWASAHF
jgi:AraC-like DNA-binding protein